MNPKIIKRELSKLVEEINNDENSIFSQLRIASDTTMHMVTGEFKDQYRNRTSRSFIVQYFPEDHKIMTYPGENIGTLEDAKSRLRQWALPQCNS